MRVDLTAKGLPMLYRVIDYKTNEPKVVVEQIILYLKNYPIAMVHCDLFYHSDTYDRLMNGETVDVTIEFD